MADRWFKPAVGTGWHPKLLEVQANMAAPEVPIYHVYRREANDWVVIGESNSRASFTGSKQDAVYKARDLVTSKGDAGAVFVYNRDGLLAEVQAIRDYQYDESVDTRTLTDTGSF